MLIEDMNEDIKFIELEEKIEEKVGKDFFFFSLFKGRKAAMISVKSSTVSIRLS